MLEYRWTKQPALRLEDRDPQVHGSCGRSRPDAQAGVRRSSHKDGTLSKASGAVVWIREKADYASTWSHHVWRARPYPLLHNERTLKL